MTFSLEAAKRIVHHYGYLIGKEISVSFPKLMIEHIVIVPTDEGQHRAFINYFFTTGTTRQR